VRIFGTGRREAERERREDNEYSLKASWYSRGCIDLIDEEKERKRKERRYIHDRPSVGPTIFNRLLNP
jgi:hypothetical protein